MILHVLTPTVRPENLDAVGSSLFAALRRAPELRLSWHVSVDVRREHIGGWGLRNEMLESLFFSYLDQHPDEWVFLLDDDTTVHPELFKRFWEEIQQRDESTDLFLVGQTRPNGWDPGCGDPTKLKYGKDVGLGDCAFDAGQAIFRLDLVTEYRFVEDDHDSDGYLWRDVLSHIPIWRIAWTDDVLAYYNALRPS